MTTTPTSLWDNLHLLNGLSLLSELQMEKAIEQLNLALRGQYELEDTQQALETAQFWKTRIYSTPINISDLLADYASFSFSPRLTSFRKGLLEWIADKIAEQHPPVFNQAETVFDHLLTLKNYQKAETFISIFIHQYPGKKHWFCLLAQAQWRKGNEGKANRNYILALLHASDDVPVNRIENDKLQNLISEFGPAMTPAYAWIKSIVSFADIKKDEIPICNEQHQKALNSYNLLKQAHTSQKNNDTKTAIQYRKQLKTEAPELYKAYFELLNNR